MTNEQFMDALATIADRMTDLSLECKTSPEMDTLILRLNKLLLEYLTTKRA